MRSLLRRLCPLLLFVLILVPGWAAGQKKPDNEGFEPVSMPANMQRSEESIPAAPLVAAAYGFIWVAVLVFVSSVAMRTRRLERQVRDLEAQLGRARPA